MIYLITEDQTSARDFWIKVFETYYEKSSYKILPLTGNNGGNTTLITQVNQAFNVIRKDDTLVIAFDNISNTKSFSTKSFIKYVQAKCKRGNIKLYMTVYYSFEELYLSYSELLDMCNKCNIDKTLQDILRYVYDNINKHIDYFDNSNYYINAFKNMLKRSNNFKNREHFASQLLTFITIRLNGHFRISKQHNDLGECWVENCKQIQSSMSTQQKNNVCDNQCKFCCKNCTTKEKLNDLQKKSMQQYLIDFDKIV